MGFLSGVSSIVPPPRMRAEASSYQQAFFSGDDLPGSWAAALSAAGVTVTPDLARTLSAYACGVDTISYDLGTLLLRAFKNRPDGGKTLVAGSANGHEAGIANLVYKLQWQPNDVQTAAEFFGSQIAQLLMRNVAYAEIIPSSMGFVDQLLPRHPDRVRPERLPSGRLRYKLIEIGGKSRYVTQEEMFVIRDLSSDGGLSPLSRVGYGANAIGTALAAERAAGKFFKSGMTAAILATYTGDMEDEQEAELHASITRYAAGVENTFGLMLVPDDVKVTNLAIEPEKAQMMLAREWTVYEVARMLRISPRKLMIGKTATYASSYQDSIDHVVNCLRPLAVLTQQSIQRDLVIAKDVYSFVFHLGELLKGDPVQMGDYIEKLISSRAMTPSEVRMAFLDMNPDPHLDQLSESDNQPGKSGTPKPAASASSSRATLKGMLALHDNAVRCLRRERAAVEKLAKKHASDVDGWKAALREFYSEHAGFVAQTMRVSLTIARGYAAQHGSAFEAQGVVLIDGDAGEAWERCEADELCALAMDDERSAA